MFSGELPKGLRVLAFDEDLQHLLMLEKYLQEFQYEVIICNEEERAMYLLRNHRNMFDIVIVEAQSSDGDRLRMISEFGSDMDPPIIIISTDDSVKSVTNGMRNGACDYLIKPIRPDDVRFIFKHVVKKNIRSVAVAGEAGEKAAGQKSSSVGDSTISTPNKRKKSMFLDGQADKEDQDQGRVSRTKKRRVVWDDNLKAEFIKAVNILDNGSETHAVPKKILEMMNVRGITRENVASHLQKYRLKKKQKNDQRDERNRFPTHHINNIPQPSSIQQQNTNCIPQPSSIQQQNTNYIPQPSSIQQQNTNYIPQPSSIQQQNTNYIPQPSSIQQQNTNCNLMTDLIPLLGHHDDDGVHVAVSSGNLLMNHQHQMPELAWTDQNVEERLFDNEADEDEARIANLTRWFSLTPEEISLFPYQEPVIATANDSQFFANPQEPVIATANDSQFFANPQEPVIATTGANDSQIFANPQHMTHVHGTSMVHIPSVPSSLTQFRSS